MLQHEVSTASYPLFQSYSCSICFESVSRVDRRDVGAGSLHSAVLHSLTSTTEELRLVVQEHLRISGTPRPIAKATIFPLVVLHGYALLSPLQGKMGASRRNLGARTEGGREAPRKHHSSSAKRGHGHSSSLKVKNKFAWPWKLRCLFKAMDQWLGVFWSWP